MGGYFLFVGQGIAFATPSNISAAEKNAAQDPDLNEIPNGFPIIGNAKISSSYGRRIDPFTHQTGFHARIDFSATPGTPILAAALHGLAALTGVARVQADKHTWGDVIAGGAIRLAMSEIFTDQKNYQLTVLSTPKGMQVAFRSQW